MESLARILPGLMRELGLEESAAGWRAVSEWPALAGERVARRARATGFRDGVLTVEVEGSAWMHELGFLKRELVRRANEHIGVPVVREVRFVLARGGNQRCD
jgi:predicted nucleic acid-binding Zn ribbon protein